MKRYNLRVFYPSSNEYSNGRSKRYYEISVEAYNFTTTDGIYLFLDTDGELVCTYPLQCTIIESVEDIGTI